MKFTWKDGLKIFAVLFALYLGIHYWPSAIGLLGAVVGAAMPLITGCVIAYLVNILMSFYERLLFSNAKNGFAQKLRRPLCMTGAFATLIAIVALIFGLIVPQLVSCVRLIIEKIPSFMSAVLQLIDQWEIVPDDIISQLAAIDWNSKIGEIFQVLTSGLGDVMGVVVNTVSSVFSGIVTTLVALIFSIYLLSGKEKLSAQVHRVITHYLQDSWCRKLEYVAGVIDDCFHRYIVGQCIEAVILGALCAIGMSILRLPYATMIGALVGFTALIPVAGAYIGGIVGGFMILTVNPIQAIIFVIFLLILQQLEGNLIYPRVVGSSMGLPGIWVLAAVTVGGGIMGIGGMLLGVPLAAAIYRMIRDDVARDTAPAPAPVETAAVPEQPQKDDSV